MFIFNKKFLIKIINKKPRFKLENQKIIYFKMIII